MKINLNLKTTRSILTQNIKYKSSIRFFNRLILRIIEKAKNFEYKISFYHAHE